MSRKKTSSVYPHIQPNIEEWPIYKLAKNRDVFIQEIVQSVSKRYQNYDADELEEFLSRTIYLEIKRCTEDPIKVDPRNEKKYFISLRKELSENAKKEDGFKANQELLRRLVNRYAEEIVGNFKASSFRFARKFLTSLFRRLLNSAAGKNHRRLWGSTYQMYERLPVKGPVEKVRKLAQKGTVVMVPTHFSNLDSILLGYAIDAVMGLPAFNYGAGLNLYDLEIVAYFMNRLGAYKVDRRKKNPIYLDTLKMMSYRSIKSGVHTLFFPGGTRSRSGELEQDLKLGLLGTVLEAQRSIFENGKDDKIFIVPIVISYHFVLEGKYLIEQHLRKTGQEQYLASKDAAKSYTKIFQFLWGLFSQGSEIVITLGEPMDILGHSVNEEGESIDNKNKIIDIKDYFILNGKIESNPQRENVYTMRLAQKIVRDFHTTNTVLSSHLVSFVAFKYIKDMYPQDSIFTLVSRDVENIFIPYDAFKRIIMAYQEILIDLDDNGKLNISDSIEGDPDELIRLGIKNMGSYHAHKALRIDANKFIVTDDLKLLYYYHNRLEHYELDKRYITAMKIKQTVKK